MRILMLAQSFAPIIGGEERVVENLSLQLAGRGHEVTIATLAQPGVEPVEPGGGVRVQPLHSSVSRISPSDAERIYSPPLPDPETVLDLRRVLREVRPDVVHAHNWIVHSYLPLDRHSDAALVLSLHDYGLVCPTKRLLRDGVVCRGPGPVKCLLNAREQYGLAKGAVTAAATLTRGGKVRRHVDLFLPISTTVAELCRLGPGDPYEVMPNFIGELPPPPAEESALANLPDGPYALYFGDITEDKGADRLIEAYSGLEGPRPLVLIGRNFLGEGARGSNVRLLGPMPYPLVIEALRRSAFTIAPSVWAEPFGMVALEAAKAGKPIVASNIGGLKDTVVNEETGLLVPPGETAPLRAALQRMLGDAELRSRLGTAAARRADRWFSPESLVPKVEAAYQRAIDARRRPGSGSVWP
jgi:glycosyltransferase involved in cell wall biosynthesis